jgi:RNA polymerase sigma factor (sigma-70 family)
MSDMVIDRLARAFHSGDRESFRFLVESLSRTLIAMAYRYTKDWDTARDLTQETWIKVYERIDRFDPGRSFKNWLLTVHRNGCINHMRKAAVRLEVKGVEMLETAAPGFGQVHNPTRRIEQIEFMQRVHSAMKELSKRERTVFSLVDIEHNGQTEAAEILEMNPNTLRTTLHHERKKLACTLRKMEE